MQEVLKVSSRVRRRRPLQGYTIEGAASDTQAVIRPLLPFEDQVEPIRRRFEEARQPLPFGS
jgi:hypothetical protein